MGPQLVIQIISIMQGLNASEYYQMCLFVSLIYIKQLKLKDILWLSANSFWYSNSSRLQGTLPES